MFTKALVFDTETTGIPIFRDEAGQSVAADDPRQPRLASISAALIDLEWNEIRLLDALVAPDGWEMPPEALALNGLTTEHLIANGAPIAEILGQYDEMLSECDLVVCFSLAFDMKIMRGELRRVGMPDRYGEKPVFDIKPTCQTLCKGRMPAGKKSVTLLMAHELILGEPFVNPHTSICDMRAVVRLLRHIHGLDLLKPKMQPMNKPAEAA
jgi:DNA polymerase III epsilon subunit-like protein